MMTDPTSGVPLVDIDFEYGAGALLIKGVAARARGDEIARAIVDKIRRGRYLSEAELAYLREVTGATV